MEHHAAAIKNKERFHIMLWSDHQNIPPNGNKQNEKKVYVYMHIYIVRYCLSHESSEFLENIHIFTYFKIERISQEKLNSYQLVTPGKNLKTGIQA